MQLVFDEYLAGTAAGMYGLRRLQIGRCGELTKGSPRARLLLALFPVLSPALSSKMSPHPLS